MTRIAITRAVSPALANCELTHLERRAIDIDLARKQHAAYQKALRDAGCEVLALEALNDFADSVFVEDTAIVLDNVAVLTRPGAASRRGEIEAMAAAVAPFRECVSVEAPATLDGGDVLRLGRVLHVGASARSNADGVGQLRRLVAAFGYSVVAVPMEGCLHLKSAVTQVAHDLLLVNPAWVDASRFAAHRILNVGADEPFAAKVLNSPCRARKSSSRKSTAS